MDSSRLNSDRTTGRRVPLRMRPDLVLQPQRFGRERYWVVKDPVALTYFHLRDEEHAILEMLDGRVSLEEIKRRFEEVFAPLQTTFEHLHAFLGRLYNCGLVVSDAPGQGEPLLERNVRRRRQECLQSLGSILAIQFRGIDPEPFLKSLHAKAGWVFSRWFVFLVLAFAAAALGLVAVHADVLASRLPDFDAFFSIRNAVCLAVALALTKVLHELGHALACKHFGGECHEMGVMFLVFTPCLYCNVSDAWMLSNKWHRVAISAAGMYVEIFLASVATFLWWFSAPGLLNTLCLNVMVVCSVSTLVFNGNPLLRYDGYYILSDILEVPNLGQQSRALLARGLGKLLLGIAPPADRSLPRNHRWLIASYGVASTVYRWCIVAAILWFCHKSLAAYSLGVVANLLVLVVVVGMLAGPVLNLARFLRDPAWQRRIRWPRAVASGIALVVLLIAFLAVPVPHSVTAPTLLEPKDGRRVYVSVPGTLARCAAEGTPVEAEQVVAELEDRDLLRRIEGLRSERDQQALRLKNLELRLAGDASVASQIPAARESLVDVESRLRQLEQDQERLTLTAPVSGTVLPPPFKPAPSYAPGKLQPWFGSPLEPRNLGCHLETGTLFCLVGDPASLEATLVVSQSELAFVKPGQRVRIELDELPGEVLSGTIAEIARTDLEVVPRELALRVEVPSRVDEGGLARPLQTCYQVRVSLDDHEGPLLTGACGRGRIAVASQSLGRRLLRYLQGTFRFPT